MLRVLNKSIRANRCFHTGSIVMGKKVAVVLSGCGVYDGTEVHEASACLVHLSRAGAEVKMFAPDVEQMHSINHVSGEVMDGGRNVLVESARIGRGMVEPLALLNEADFDALVFPGGFGAAKNLSSWAVDNIDCDVNNEVEKTIKDFHSNKKPIRLTCIAPVLAAKCLPGVEVTLGHAEGDDWPYSGTVGAVQQCGGVHVEKDVTECHVDTNMRIVTTPAYMCNTSVHRVFDGIGEMVNKLLKLC
uniref:LOW QUALITY PROTEIN: glutamine amidotransferase-like class 1 domain-containing protein 3A, mitochondrial n=1 Tax=Ciona intestinalis TaxID=7719 RepID=UPI0002B8D1AB|nr:LOW QUALITY PROTEIN: glutamine amidotransferase-like class 1 domain-containing protein 3A, mitochondrial [Ciona intestinalis]|eukprot:XP_026693623.1 LOW QUALITY PROTEIN: glutamine amidotransferase-like class 1 domain-containing protein 3A, mitochondrial [Ciona intestinalis]